VRTISRYFVRRYLGMFAAILTASTLSIIIVEMLLNLDDMLRARDGSAGAVKYLFLRIPSYYLRELVPITSFAATFFSLGLASHHLEILAAKSGGISTRRILLPILAGATLLALGYFVVGETWIVGSTREWNRGWSQDRPEVHFRHGSFWYQRGHTIYSVASADPTTNTLRGVRLFELNREGRLLRSISSQHVDVEPNHRWRFHDVSLVLFRPGDPLAAPIPSQLPELTLDVGDRGDIESIDTDLQSLSLRNLRGYMRDRLAEGEAIHRAETIYHTRLADSASLILFALLAAPLGLQVEERNSFGIPALWGIATVAIFFTLRSVSLTLASEGILSAAVSIWSLMAFFALVGCARLVHLRG
jgi:lipopolysaccharide export system permease protein